MGGLKRSRTSGRLPHGTTLRDSRGFWLWKFSSLVTSKGAERMSGTPSSNVSRRLEDPVRAIVDDVTALKAPAVVVARGVERIKAFLDERDRPAERIQRENATALEQ